jgi:hypothetical protein
MRRLAYIVVVSCLALAGCGGGGEEEQAAPVSKAGGAGVKIPPGPTPQPLGYDAGAKPALAAGAIGVVDLRNKVGVEPDTMDVNREQRLERLRWSGWGSARATGRGGVRTLVCEPSCANGTIEESTAVIVLSAPKRCGERRLYTRSTMTYDDRETGKTRAPATYLRTPPC